MKKLILVLAFFVLTLMQPVSAFARDDLKNTDPERYFIYLDTGNQIVSVYEKDDAGEYTRVVRRMICTSGRTEIDPEIPEDQGTPTPSGTWHVGARERFGKFASFENEYARYWTQIVDGVYCHSIMFGARSADTLKRSAYAKLGSSGSHGCVRLLVEDAKWLYYYACPGTRITVGSRAQGAQTEDYLPDMSFSQYDDFQKNIYDEPEQDNWKARVVAEEATLRTGNGSKDSVIEKLKAGDELEILQAGDPWVKALYDGKEGYVKRAYISYHPSETESVPDGLYLRATSYLYEKPSVKAERLCKIPHDASLILTEQADVPEGWTKIRYWTQEGYIQSRAIARGWATVYRNDDMTVDMGAMGE